MITRSITRPITSPIARAVTAAYGAWNPRALFALGEQGLIYDPNDLSTLYQNSAGTVPVTAAGQPVGRMLDKSGRGNHVSFGDGATRPMLRFNIVTGYFYLEPDGADDFGVTPPIDFTGTDKVSVFTGVRKLSDAASGVVFELGTDTGSVNGTFRLSAPASAGAQKFLFVVRGTSGQEADTASTAWNAPVSVVASGVGNISGSSVKLRLNGADIETTAATLGTGNYGNYPLYLFRRGGTSLPFSGHFYGLTIVGRLTTDAETRNVERLYANKTGVTLA